MEKNLFLTPRPNKKLDATKYRLNHDKQVKINKFHSGSDSLYTLAMRRKHENNKTLINPRRNKVLVRKDSLYICKQIVNKSNKKAKMIYSSAKRQPFSGRRNPLAALKNKIKVKSFDLTNKAVESDLAYITKKQLIVTTRQNNYKMADGCFNTMFVSQLRTNAYEIRNFVVQLTLIFTIATISLLYIYFEKYYDHLSSIDSFVENISSTREIASEVTEPQVPNFVNDVLKTICSSCKGQESSGIELEDSAPENLLPNDSTLSSEIGLNDIAPEIFLPDDTVLVETNNFSIQPVYLMENLDKLLPSRPSFGDYVEVLEFNPIISFAGIFAIFSLVLFFASLYFSLHNSKFHGHMTRKTICKTRSVGKQEELGRYNCLEVISSSTTLTPVKRSRRLQLIEIKRNT